MKKFTLILLLSFFTLQAYTQLPPWNTKFVVYHPDGYTDTLWIGCDENATDGYDEGLDIIDTSFDTPIAIRGYDEEVESEFGFGSCVNLKRDIRSFDNTDEFTFYILSEYSGLDNIYLAWDSLELNYETDSIKMSSALLFSTYGYINAIDQTLYIISDRDDDNDSIMFLYNDSIPIYFESSAVECSSLYQILRLSLKTTFFNYLTLIENSINGIEELAISPNPAMNFMNIKNLTHEPCTITIMNMQQKIIDSLSLTSYQTLNYDISNISTGIYILSVFNEEQILKKTYKIYIL